MKKRIVIIMILLIVVVAAYFLLIKKEKRSDQVLGQLFSLIGSNDIPTIDIDYKEVRAPNLDPFAGLKFNDEQIKEHLKVHLQ